MKQTAKALLYLLTLALGLAPVLLLVTLPLLLVARARKLLQHVETKHLDKNKQSCKTVLVTGAPHTKVKESAQNRVCVKICLTFLKTN